MSEKVARLCEECSKGNLKNIKKLLKGSLFVKGVPVDAVTNVKISMLSGMTPLMSASMFGRVYVARYLIEAGADINARSLGSENTALIYAASNNNLETVKLLLQNNADKTMKNRDGLTALDYAEKYKYLSIIRLLKDVPFSDKYNSTEIVSTAENSMASETDSEKIGKIEKINEEVEKKEVITISEQQLITLRLLLGGARAWGQLNGSPLGREYPQYSKVREIGKKTFGENGSEGLELIMNKIKADGSDLYTYLDLMWENLQSDTGDRNFLM